MVKITAAEVSKLRQMTGAGMMDCKKALVEAEGDFDKARDLIRERGLAIANKRADRQASEGAVLAKTVNDNTIGVVVALNCETDFVAKNDDFIALAHTILDVAADKLPADIEALKNTEVNGKTIAALITEKSGITGEKMELAYYGKVEGAIVSSYIHMGNKLATVVALNKAVDKHIPFDIAMQVAAMNPVAVDKDSVPQDVIDKELEIGREQAKNDGKTGDLVEKIAQGKLQKFFKEQTLMNQELVLEGKISVRDYLHKVDKELKVTDFKRYALAN